MKNTILLILFVATLFFSTSVNGQKAINQSLFNNTSWVLSGSYTNAGLVSSPKSSYSFSFDDNLAGNTVDSINVDFPLDITPAKTAVQGLLKVYYKYRFRKQGQETLEIQYFNVDSNKYLTLKSLEANDLTTIGNYCANISYLPTDSIFITIGDKSSAVLSGFKLRIAYNDKGVQGRGFCVNSLKIVSDTCAFTPQSNISVTDVMSTTALVNVAALPNFYNKYTNYFVEIDTSFVFRTAKSVTTTSKAIVTGLIPSRTHYVRFRAVCMAGDSSAVFTSNSIQTICAPFSLPYKEDFDSYVFAPGLPKFQSLANFDCLSSFNNPQGQNAFSISHGLNDLGRLRFETFPFSTPNYLFVGNTNLPEAVLRLPNFNFVAGKNYVVKFKARSQASIGFKYSIKMGTSPNYKDYEAASKATPKPTILIAEKTAPTAEGDPYKRYYENFTVPTTGNRYIAIVISTGTNGTFLSFDDVEIYERPDCDKPYVLKLDNAGKTTLRYSWLGTPDADGYQTDFALAGVAVGSGTLTSSPSNSATSLETKSSLVENTNYRIYVRAVCGANFSVWEGPLTMKTLPSCIAPEDIKVSPLLGGKTAEIKFKDPNTGLSNTFQREVELNSLTFGTGKRGIFTTTNDSDHIDGLAPKKGYAYYLRKICSATDTSKWVGPALFKTKCDTAAIPYSEGFEGVGGLDKKNNSSINIPECMEVYSSTPYPTIPTYQTHYDTLSYGRYPRTGHKYIVTSSGTTWLVLPGFNLKKGELYKLSFYWTNDGGRRAHSFSVYRGTSNLESYQKQDKGTLIEKVDVPILPISSGFNNSTGFNNYHRYDGYIKATATAKEYISIKITSDNNNMIIDDISFEKVTGCPPPFIPKLTSAYGDSALITWKALQTGATYELDYQAVGGTPHIAGSGTILTTTDTFIVIKGLLPRTNYSYYVRSDCGTSKSDWTPLQNFNSGCPIYVDSWSDGFEVHPALVGGVVETQEVPPCYKITHINGRGIPTFRSATSFFERKPRTGTNYLYFGQANEDILHLPSIILQANTSYIYENYYTSTGNGWSSATLYAAESDEDLSTQTGITLDASALGPHTSGVWQKYEVEFTVSKTDTYKLGLKMNVRSFPPWFYSIDDISIKKKSACKNALTNYKFSGEANQVTVSVSNPLKTATSPIGYEFAYKIKGTPTFLGRKLTTVTTATFTGLQYSTEYVFVARPICGVGDTAIYPPVGGTFKTPCSQSLPYTMGFESTESTKLECLINNSELKWKADHTGKTTSDNTGPLKAATGSRYAYLETTTKKTRERSNLITPRLTFDVSKDPLLKYKYSMYGATVDSFIVDIEVPAFSNNWVNVHSEFGDKGTPDWVSKHINIKSNLSTADNFRVRFTAIDVVGGDKGDIALDDISISYVPSCAVPFEVKATDITSSSAKFTWDRLSPTNNIDWQYALDTLLFKATKTDLGTFNAAVPNSLTVTPNGLRSGREYQFYLRATCANLDTSDWVGPINFTTACIETLPYTMSFESIEATKNECLIIDSKFKWITNRSGETPTSNTGPLKAASGTVYAYIETSTFPSKEKATLITPRLNFDVTKESLLEYKYNMFGSSVDSFIVDIEVPAFSNNWINIHSEYGNKMTQDWFTKNISIQSTLGTADNFRVRFSAIDASGQDLGDIALDDINIFYKDLCPKPFNIKVTDITMNSAKFDWEGLPSANNDWQYALDTLPFSATNTDLGSFNGAITNALTVTPTGLRAGKDYQFYLRATCSGNLTSDWVGPVNFSTICSETLPYTMGFESNETFKLRCYENNSKLKWTTNHSRGTPSNNTGPKLANPATGTRYAYIETGTFSSKERAVLITPRFTFDVSKDPVLEYKYSMFGSSVDSFIVDLEVPAFSNNWVNVHSEYGDKKTQSWLSKSINIKSNLGTADNFRVRFIATDITGKDLGDIALDDITLSYLAPCPEPLDVKVTDVSLTSAKFTWNRLSNTSTEWEYALDTLPFSPTVTSLGKHTGTVSNALTVTQTSLSSGKVYQFYLRNLCASNTTSRWVGPVNFFTLCLEQVPYTVGFNDGKDRCWIDEAAKSDGTTWIHGNSSTNHPTLTGPDGPQEGTGYLTINLNNPILSSDTVSAISSAISFDRDKAPFVSYFRHMRGRTMGNLRVLVETYALSNVWKSLTLQQGDKGNVWIKDKFYFADSVDVGKTSTRFKFEASTLSIPRRLVFFGTDMAIDNFKVEDSPSTDLELSSIVLGGSSCGNSRPLNLTVTNKGYTQYPVGTKIPYTIKLANSNRTLLDTIVLTAPLDFEKKVTAMVNLTLSDGYHSIAVAINYSGDVDHTNDNATVSGSAFHNVINTYPVVENFSNVGNSLWKVNPASVNSSVVITSKNNRPTVSGGPRTYVDKDTALVMTNPTGLYKSNENSTIETVACLDLSAVCYPIITFDLWNETQSGHDGLILEANYSGNGWVVIGSENDPEWYDEKDKGFSEQSNPAWRTYSHKLDTFGGKSNVRLRFRFNSDGVTQMKGIALDNITIADGYKLPKDSLFCGNLADLTTTPIPLRVIFNQSTDKIIWSTNDDIPNITVNKPGIYTVRVFEQANVNCGYADTFKLFHLATPLPKATKDMFQDQSSCGSVTLKIPEEFNETSKYTWSKGGVALSTMDEYKIATSGEYIVDVKNSCENFKDTVNIMINPLPVVELKADHTTLIDGGTPSSTQVYSDAPNSFDHSWSHASTKDSSFTLTTAILDQFGKLLENLITVEVTDNNGCKGRDTITITYKDNKGVKDITNNVSITVAPNPSNGIFTVGFDASNYESIRFKVLDLLGRELIVKEVKKSVGRISEKVNLTGYPEGIYLLIIATDKGFITNKLSLTR